VVTSTNENQRYIEITNQLKGISLEVLSV